MRIDYLRISVTDRCNLQCIYCNPLPDSNFLERGEILRFEEIERLVRLFVGCGISRIRLTGGEPLVRRNIVSLVGRLAAAAGVKELLLTTNGVSLEQMAGELKRAGLKRVNVSLDSPVRETYERITGLDALGKVMGGIHKAIEVGLTPMKINTVVLRGVNESDTPALAALSLEMPVTVRFIEYCPTDKEADVERFFVPNSCVRRRIEEKFGKLAATAAADSNGPAVYFRISGGLGNIGFISGKTTYFCHRCNRLRLTSDGKVKPCLYSDVHYDLKKLIRGGADDERIVGLIKEIMAEKHLYTKLNSFRQSFLMRNVGG
jgi:cyclic pyranopterin phosphate synthase